MKLNYTEAWNFIVEERNKFFNEKEDVVQKRWESYFAEAELFGYSKIKGDIKVGEKLHIGSKDREIPDIIICIGNIEQFVVELKQLSFPKTNSYELQLLTYLSHPSLRLPVGVLICEKIYIYYYDHADGKIINLEIPFEKDNLNGAKFIEIFQKWNFTPEKVKTFINDCIQYKKDIVSLQNEINEQKIKEILKDYFEKKYNIDAVSYVLSDMDIDVKIKHYGENPVYSYANIHEAIESEEKVEEETENFFFEWDDISALAKKSGKTVFSKGDYHFDFKRNIFKYKGNDISLSPAEKRILAKWLLAQKKDHNTSSQLYLMRKRFGKDFLADIDKYGNLFK